MKCHAGVVMGVSALLAWVCVAACEEAVPEDSSARIVLADGAEPAGWLAPSKRQIPAAVPASPGPRSRLAQRLAVFAAEVARAREAAASKRAQAPAVELTSAAGPPAVFDVDGLAEEIGKIVARLERTTDVSVHIRELASDDVLFDYHGDAPLNPASNHKLLTTAAALDLLGPEFRFETRALRAGTDLYVIGEGDPTLDEVALQAMAGEIAAGTDAGSLRRLVIDDLAFSPRTLAPGFSDEGVGVSYQAPSGALSLNFNTVEVTVRAPKKLRGKPASKEPPRLEVELRPPSTHLVALDLATVGRGTLAVRTYAGLPVGEQARTVVELTGKLRPGRSLTVRRRVVDPGLYTGGALAVMLAEKTGTPPLPGERGSASAVDDAAVGVLRRESEPLTQVAGGALAWSNNFMAEQLLRTLGWRMTGEPGDWENGAEVVQAYWTALGLPADALVFENGSGFSQRGRVTTTALVDLISVAAGGNNGLVSALPVAGENGTLRARLRRSGKRVRAKTGTMDGISGLSGVITAEDGTPQVAFSILSNVRAGGASAAARRKRAEDAIVTAVLAALDAWALERLPVESAP